MDYIKELEKYAPAHTDAQVAKEVAKIKMAANRNCNNICLYAKTSVNGNCTG